MGILLKDRFARGPFCGSMPLIPQARIDGFGYMQSYMIKRIMSEGGAMCHIKGGDVPWITFKRGAMCRG